MRFNNLPDWLRWQESSHKAAIDLGLERISQVASRMGLLQTRATVITVAGTNGKGTCVCALQALVLASGKTCGAFTSPHIQRYNERIRINSQEVSNAQLCEAFDVIDQARGNISLTYFEFGTLAALYLFSAENLDYWLLEVGLGGRLDASNVIDSDLAIVTSIDLDHMDWLGDNREAIGREKAGVFRAGRHAVCADPQPPQSLLDHAKQLECSLSLYGRDFGFKGVSQGSHSHKTSDLEQNVIFWSSENESEPVETHLPNYSLAAAFHAAHLLKLPMPSRAEVKDLFGHLSLAGRLQSNQVGDKTILLDVAHNPAAMAYLASRLASSEFSAPVAAVVAMMADKNITQSLEFLLPIVDDWGLTTIVDCPRAATVDVLYDVLPSSCSKQQFRSVKQALDVFMQDENIGAILVTGSFYTVTEAQCWIDEFGKGHEAVG